MDQKLKAFDITTKQWFLLASIEKLGGLPATIDEISETMGCSHQNVKKLALKLEQKGFVQIVKDQKDKRVSRILVLEKVNLLRQNLNESAGQLFNTLFRELDKDQLISLFEQINRISAALEGITPDLFADREE
jgi:DNA-binding MarR family transcriptional regulator